MEQYIPKSALVAELKRQISAIDNYPKLTDTQIAVLEGNKVVLTKLLSFIDTIEVKEVDLVIHTIIAECCDWLAMTTNLSHDEIEGCRNLMLTVKEEEL